MRTLPLESSEIDPRTVDAWRRHLGSVIEDTAALRAELARGSLPEAFAESARGVPMRPALSIGGREVSHGELDAMAGRAAASLSRLGVGETHMMLVAAVGLEEICAYLGALRLGATIVLVDPTLTASEMHELATSSAASILVGSGPALEVAAKIGPSEVREIVGLRPGDRAEATAQVDLSNDEEEAPVRPVDPESIAILAFTSGTTGRPKPTPLSHRNLLASIRGVMGAWRWTRDDHLVHFLPISHQHGLSGLHATLLAGSRATLLGRLEAEVLIDTVSNQDASVHFGVPVIYQRLLERLGDRARRLSGLRIAISGSGPLPVDLARLYQEVTGDELLERYGTTESGLDVSNLYDGPRVPGTVGLPLPGVEVALMRDDGELADSGDAGEVLIRGPQVFGGYLGIPESGQPFIADWFRTGDIGTRDEATGCLRIVGRAKDVIISGGMNVYPREIEDAMRSLPEVEDAAVVGVGSPEWGEEVVALVAPRHISPVKLQTHLADRLAPYKRPKRIVPVDRVPRNSVGKVTAEELRRLISADGSTMPPDGIGSSVR